VAELDPVAWVAAAHDRNERWITSMALTEASVAEWPNGDLRKALAALRRISGLAEQWYGEQGNDYSASALFASKLREVLREELLGKEESGA
jgi:Cdc6-like AAA superfamily ATPase